MPDEVEDFLRRVAQMRAQAEAKAKGQTQQPQQPKQKKPKGQRPQQPPAPRSIAPAPISAQVVDAELADRSDRVARLVDDDLRGTQQIAEHTRRLGADVDAADDRLQAHLHQVFDHKLGELKATATESAPAEPGKSIAEMSADQVLRMLRSPASVRDAVIMAEVLKRPDF